MTISNYPRLAHPIAPSVLAPFLRAPIPTDLRAGRPPQFQTFGDLDATVWNYWSQEECRHLGCLLIAQVRDALSSASRSLRSLPIPLLPIGTTLDDLELETRTRNALYRKGHRQLQVTLAGKPLGYILEIPHIGAAAFVDLLTSIEAYSSNTTLNVPDSQMAEGTQGAVQLNLPLSTEAALAKEGGTPQYSQAVVNLIEQLQHMPQSKVVYHDDPRLGPMLRAIDPGARSIADLTARLLAGSTSSTELPTFWERLQKLHDQLIHCTSLRLEEELSELAQAIYSQGRGAAIVISALGWDGFGGQKLQVVGDKFDVTRERVRQIVKRATDRLQTRRPFTPILDQVIVQITSLLPDVANEIELELEASGLTRGPFQLEGIQTAAKVLQRDLAFSLSSYENICFVHTTEPGDLARVIVQTARKAMGHSGAATVVDIAEQVAEDHGYLSRAPLVEHVVQLVPGFAWLDRNNGWFWIASVPRNRLVNAIYKVLSVVEWIDARELREGVRRHYRAHGFAPPTNVLLTMCTQLPGVQTEGTKVRANPPLDWVEKLEDTEETMVRILKEHNGVLARQEFEELCLAAGMNRSTFYVYIMYSPVIKKYARGVYGLRGHILAPGVVESLSPRIARGKVLQDFGWTQDGKIWLGYIVSDAVLGSGVVGVPVAMKTYLSGEYPLHTTDGVRIGMLVIRDTSAWGLGPFFRRRGGDAGDTLVIVIDVAERAAVISIGETGLIDDLLDE